jgi:hypothetical protein
MASSSNKTPSATTLQNSYFFYGTHPLKVPNTLIHANSTTSLATDQNSNHLSLNLTNSNRHGFSSSTDLTTTKSLHNLTKSRPVDDENDEVKNKKSLCLFFMFITYICHSPNYIIIRINIDI